MMLLLSILMIVLAVVATQIYFNLDDLGEGCQSGFSNGNGADKLKIDAMRKPQTNVRGRPHKFNSIENKRIM